MSSNVNFTDKQSLVHDKTKNINTRKILNPQKLNSSLPLVLLEEATKIHQDQKNGLFGGKSLDLKHL